MKTAMQQAIEWLKISEADNHTQEIFSEFLDLEKQQIADAFNAGSYPFVTPHMGKSYYNETYNSNTPTT